MDAKNSRAFLLKELENSVLALELAMLKHQQGQLFIFKTLPISDKRYGEPVHICLLGHNQKAQDKPTLKWLRVEFLLPPSLDLLPYESPLPLRDDPLIKRNFKNNIRKYRSKLLEN